MINNSTKLADLSVDLFMKMVQKATQSPVPMLADSSSSQRVIGPPPVFRELNKKTTFQMYKKEVGAEIRTGNAVGLGTIASFMPIDILEWEQAKKQELGESYYKKVSKMETEEDKELFLRWKTKAEAINNARELQQVDSATLERERKSILRQVRKLNCILQTDHSTQLQGMYYNINTGRSEDCSTGKYGKLVSVELDVHPSVPSLFDYFVNKERRNATRQSFPLPPLEAADRTIGNAALRKIVARELLQKLNNALASFRKKSAQNFQISRLLSEKGYNGICMKGYPFQSNENYAELNIEECNLILDSLDDISFERVAVVEDLGAVEVEAENTHRDTEKVEQELSVGRSLEVDGTSIWCSLK
ncbi:UNVERIFIED_CONTAM: hypothetical protein HDU68_003751 [Siphonaria sp. JEL0065]|nr:hypothetical protein HDU68_003751 [Siphonaria sp. JEL0065]